jgi:site-specific recombinase XerC
VPDVRHPLGIRDRAMLETLYSSGIRRAELCSLAVADLDRERGTLMVREGVCVYRPLPPERIRTWQPRPVPAPDDRRR